ncbi:MAG: DUF1553 domain-containing protein, partial [Planctomycetes bacterium]|nr:DUF1553 domain-containing protein [Planctomycetota bacterium]
MICSRCHDHKYDPFTQRDFYSLKAFFHNVTESGLGQYGKPVHLSNPPFLKLSNPETDAALNELGRQVDDFERQQADRETAVVSRLEGWAKEVLDTPAKWSIAPLVEVRTDVEATQIVTEAPHQNTLRIPKVEKKPGDITVVAKPEKSSTQAIRIRLKTDQKPATIKWSELKIELEDSSGTKKPLKPLPIVVGKSMSVEDGRKLLDDNRQTVVDLSIGESNSTEAVFLLNLDSLDQTLAITIGVQSSTDTVLVQVETTSDRAEKLLPDSIDQIVKKSATERSNDDQKLLVRTLASFEPSYRELTDQISKLNQKKKELDESIPTTLVMDELASPRDTFILMRGAYDKPGEKVTANTPSVLPPMAENLPKNRLGLANWLVDPSNPLPARVTVNRYWQLLFGTGIVRTAEDFGTQGEAPSHSD